MTSRSFGRLTSDPQEIHEAIRQHAQRSAVIELERPTDDSREILHAASRALENIYRPW